MSLLDKHLPRYQFRERHQLLVHAPPERVMAAVIGFQPPRDRITEGLMWLRGVPTRLTGRRAPAFGLHSFTPLASDGTSETAAGLVGRFWRLDGGLVPLADAEAFDRFAEPRTPKLVIGFRATAEGVATRLSTETRVFCPDRYSLVRFAPYWVLIRLASGLIRRRALAAIKAIVEAPA
jgi:hypothetical protein